MNDPDEEPIDPIPAQNAAIDQMQAEMPQQAKAARVIYEAYLGEGFTADEAFGIVTTYLMHWLSD